jgi:hypothetical protein
MYHPPSKQKQVIQRIVVYGLMCISVLVLVTLLVFVMLGYQFNKADGKIEQGGLVQFSSTPGGANVGIDSKSFGTQTAARTTMTSGSHFITMNKTGYRQWQKTVDVLPGSVLWLNYSRLIPTTLKPSTVATYGTVSDSNVSPDRKWLAIKEDPTTPAIRMENISGSTVKASVLDLPAASYTAPSEGKTQSFVIAQWDPNSRYLLVKHTYDDTKTEWLVVDIQHAETTKNMTTLLGFDASNVMFSNTNSSVLYGIVGQDLRKIDLGAVTLSGPLVTNVAEFSLYQDSTIIYSTSADPVTHARTVGYYSDGANKPRTIRSYADDGQSSLHMAFGSYYGDNYVAIAYGNDVEVLTGDLPRSDTSDVSTLRMLTTMTVPGGVLDLSIITSGRFVVAQTAAGYVVYDLELKKTSTTTLPGPAVTTEKLHWLDNYMTWSDRDGTLRTVEFDGANQQTIMPATPGFSVTLSPDGTYLYGFLKTPAGKYELQRVRMILP